jgi:hypothetical protein
MGRLIAMVCITIITVAYIVNASPTRVCSEAPMFRSNCILREVPSHRNSAWGSWQERSEIARMLGVSSWSIRLYRCERCSQQFIWVQ